jgi:UDP:flavonoid glycosyltransferase YjiC (YdhE family)
MSVAPCRERIDRMRVLFTCVSGYGHFLPLVPLAHAFRARGDTVLVAAAASHSEQAGLAGLELLPTGLDEREVNARFARAKAHSQTLPIPDRRPYVFTQRFALVEAPARVVALLERARTFEPDLIVHDASELSAAVVGAQLGLPTVHHSFGRMIPWTTIEAAVPEVAAMWERAGVEPEPHAGMFRGPFVDICPPSLESDRPPNGTTVWRRRPVDARASEQTDGRPLVYVTLGTVVRSTATLDILLAGLATLDADVLLTIGWQNDPAELSAIPANATVERFVPQDQILPRSSLIVTHAGSGSMLGALAHGIPLLAVPHAADQFDNAAAVATAGVGLVVMPDDLTEDAIREAAVALLDDPSYRDAAHNVANEIAAMPSAGEVAEQLSALLR